MSLKILRCPIKLPMADHYADPETYMLVLEYGTRSRVRHLHMWLSTNKNPVLSLPYLQLTLAIPLPAFAILDGEAGICPIFAFLRWCCGSWFRFFSLREGLGTLFSLLPWNSTFSITSWSTARKPKCEPHFPVL